MVDYLFFDLMPPHAVTILSTTGQILKILNKKHACANTYTYCSSMGYYCNAIYLLESYSLILESNNLQQRKTTVQSMFKVEQF